MITKKTMLPKELLDEDVFPIVNNPLKIQTLPDRTVVDFYMPLEIGQDSKEFIDFFRAIDDLRPNDDVNIHINCYGGECSTAFQIIDHLQSSQANINVSVEGNCCSAATLIALSGDSWDIMPHSYFMCHAYSALRFGKKQEIDASHEFDKKWLDKSIREIYKGFLTDDEIDRLMLGQDFYFDADEIVERLGNYKKDEFEKQKVVDEIIEKHQKSINDEIKKRLDEFDKKHQEKLIKPNRKSKK